MFENILLFSNSMVVVLCTILFCFKVRNADLIWKEAKRQLRKDSRWDLAELLDRDEKEKLFMAHVEQLGNKKRDKFRYGPHIIINDNLIYLVMIPSETYLFAILQRNAGRNIRAYTDKLMEGY